MAALERVFWVLFVAETGAVTYMFAQALPVAAGRHDTWGDGRIAVASAITMALLLAVDGAVFHYNSDKLVRRLTLGALVVPVLITVARVVAGMPVLG